MTDSEIRNRIVTSFETEGQAKVESALNRLKLRSAEAKAELSQSTDVTERYVRAVRGLERTRALDDITKALVKANKDSKDWEESLKRVQVLLDRIGASPEEVGDVAARAAARTGGRGQQIQQFGRDLRTQLPAVPIGGFSTEQGARVIEVTGRISSSFAEMSNAGRLATVSIGAVTAGLAVLTIAVSSINEQFARQTRAIINSQEEYTRLRVSGTKEEIAAALEKQRLDNQIAQARIDENKRLLQGLEQQAGPVAAALADVFNIAGVQELRRSTEELEQQLQTGALAESRLAGLTNDTTVARRLAAEAEEEFQRRIRANDDRQALAQMEVRARKFTEESLKEEIANLELRSQLARELLRSGKLSEEAAAQLTDELGVMAAQIIVLKGEFGDAAIEADRLAKAQDEAKKRREETIEIVRAADEKIADLTNRRAEREADLYRRMNESVIKAVEQAVEATDRAIQKLEERRDDLALDLSRDERDAGRKAALDDLEAQIKFRRDEQSSLRTHLRTLRQIREDAEAAEFNIIRNRDFSALRDSRVETNRRLRDEVRSHDEQRAERQLAFAEQIEDEQRRRAFERESRLLRYQDQLEDAQIQHERELRQIQSNKQKQLAAAAKAYTNELNLLNQKHGQELSMLANAVQQELNLVAAGNQERLRLEEQFILARAAIWQQSGLLGLVSGVIGSNTTTTNNTLNAPINVQTGAGGAQLAGLVGIIRGEIAKAFSQYAGAN